MYFSENLEYCTMTYVSFCEDGVGMERERQKTPFLFWRFFALLTGRGWAAAVYPAGGDPSPQRTRTDYTAQAAAQAAHRHTRPDAGHAAPGRSGRRRGGTACAVCPAKCTISDSYFYPYLYGYILMKVLTIHIYMDII